MHTIKRPAICVVRLLLLLSMAVLLNACGTQGKIDERMDKATADLQSGQYRAAEIALKNVLQKQPEKAEAWLLLGRVSLATDQYADAAEQIRRAIAKGKDSEDVQLLLGRALVGDGDYADALDRIKPEQATNAAMRADMVALRGEAHLGLQQLDAAAKAFAKALELQPKLATGLVGQANLANMRDNPEQAKRLLAEAVAAHPEDASTLEAQGLFAYQRDECSQAIETFRQILALNREQEAPNRTFLARAYLADCLLREQQFEAAKKQVATLMQRSEKNPYANYLQALIDIRHKDYRQATTHLQRVLQATPENQRALLLMASVKLAQGDYGSAQHHLNEVIGRSPSNLDALRMLARIHMEQDEPGEAVKLLRNAYAQDRDNQQIRSLLAQAMVRQSGADSQFDAGNDRTRPLGMDPNLRLDLAVAVARSGKTDAALALLDQAAQDSDQQFRTQILKIGLHLRNGETDKAVNEAKAVVESAPGEAQPLRLLASTYLAAGRADEARQTLEQSLDETDDARAIKLDLGILALRQQALERAEKWFRDILDAAPDDTRAMMGLGRVAQRRAQRNEAEQWFDKARLTNPEDPAPAIALIQSYLVNDEPGKALPLIDKLVSGERSNAAYRRIQGVAQLAAGDEANALENFKAATRLAPGRASYRLDYARGLLVADKSSKAISVLNTLLEDAPEYMPAISMLAMIELQKGNHEAALAAAERMPDTGSGAAARSRLEAEIFAAQGEFAKAAKAYREVYAVAPSRDVAFNLLAAGRRAGLAEPARALAEWVERTPNDIDARLRLAQWHQVNDQTDAALKQYQAVLERSPDNPVALNNLALIYQSNGDSKALATAKRAYEIAPDNPAVADTLGWISVQQGDLKRGLALLRQAADKAPDAPDIQYHLAFTLAQTDSAENHTKARDILDRLLENTREFGARPDAQALREKLAGSERASAG